jgi:ATP-dependent protease ClpP protease subunit
MRQWFTMKANAEKKSAEIVIYDEIGRSIWGEDTISAKQFLADLNGLGEVDNISLRVNSPGGDVFDGVAIHNALKNHPATVTASIDGIAASAASFIVMAADRIVMPSNAFMLVHGASGFSIGNAADMRAMADDLDRIDKSLTATYAARSKSTVAKVKALMKEDRLMDADEAMQLGFADEIGEPVRMAAKFPLRLLPKAVAEKLQAAAGEAAQTPQPQPPAPPVPPVPPVKEPEEHPSEPAEPPEPEEAKPVELSAARQRGAAEHKAYVDSITDLCALAARPERVGTYVRAGTPVEQVRKDLLALRAEEQSIVAQHPLVDPSKAPAAMWTKVTDKLNARAMKVTNRRS